MPNDDGRHRYKEQHAADNIDPGLGPFGQPAGDDVDADMLVAQQRVAGAEQENRREEVPLQLEPFVRTGVERVADGCIARTDHDGGQDQPVNPTTDMRIEPVDRSEEHTSELQSLMRISYAVFCLKKTK